MSKELEGEELQQALSMLSYWWGKNEDIENGDWNKLKPWLEKNRPDIIKALADFKESKMRLKNLLETVQ